MPYARPTLSQLRAQVAADLAAALPGADPLLRFANLRIVGTAQAGLANQHYGYLDWIAKNATPFGAEDEFLYAWGALKGVYLKAASTAGDRTIGGGGEATFTGCIPGKPIPLGSPLVRGDEVEYLTLADVIVDGDGEAVVGVQAVEAGSLGNAPLNTILVLQVSLEGIQSNAIVTAAITGGANIETPEDFRSRMLQVYQNPPQGGAIADYETWALEVPGVTRAWCEPLGQGIGTVVVYFMMDEVEAAFGGFPQGTDGVATDESRGVPATGDQLLVANYIYPLRPVTALVYACAPTDSPVDFTITGIASAPVRTAIEAAIDGVFRETAEPGGTVNLLDIEAAIAAVPGSEGAVVTVPAANITSAAGHLSTRGVVTWA